MRKWFFYLFLSLGLSACVDADVDYTNLSGKARIELDKVKLRFGTTERILLKDLFKTDSSTLKSDTNQVLYWAEMGKSSTTFNVPKATVKIETHQLNINQNFGTKIWNEIKQVMQASGTMVDDAMLANGILVPAYRAQEYMEFSDSKDFALEVTLPNEVLSVSELWMDNLFFSADLQLNSTDKPTDVSKNLAIYGIKNLVIQMPDYIVSPDLNEQHQYLVPQQEFAEGRQMIHLHNLRVDRLKFLQALKRGERLANTFRISGKAKIGVKTAFTLKAVPEARIALVVKANNKQRETLSVSRIKGTFAPRIAGWSQTLDLRKQLPGFFYEDTQHLDLAQPTLRLGVDLTDVPVNVALQKAQISAIRQQNQQHVALLAKAMSFPYFSKTQVYFYEDQPYDPKGINTKAMQSQVTGLKNLLQRLPEKVVLDLDKEGLRLESNEHAIELGKEYPVTVDYALFLPFIFNPNLHIHYTKEMYHDVNWKAVESAEFRVAGVAVSTVPMACAFRVIFCDKEGIPLPTVETEPVDIAAATNQEEVRSPFEIVVKTKGNDPLKNLSQIKYVLSGKVTGQSTATLRSDQYLQLQDVHLRISGSLIHDYKE